MRYHHELPEVPPRRDFAKDTFWWRYRERFTRRRANGWSIKEAAFDWYDREEKAARLEGKAFPPAPVFTAATTAVPQPWDGREERPGRVPKTGR